MQLEMIWFFLWGLLWAIYFMTDGFDLGAGTLIPFLAKSEEDKRIILNTMGPVWDGNEVWLITAGGVTFAAFPRFYASLFSSLYLPLMIILFALILRGVSFEMRKKINNPSWRRIWDTTMFVGSFLPALFFGAVFATMFQGLSIDAAGIHRAPLSALCNVYVMLGAFFFLFLFLEHGALWITVKTEGELHRRAKKWASRLWSVQLIGILVFWGASWSSTDLFINYLDRPVLFLVPFMSLIGLIGTRIFLGKDWVWSAWLCSCLTIATATFFGLVGLYPRLLPSHLGRACDLTVFNASSSPLTLEIMLAVVLVFIPLVCAYQLWAYLLFKGPVTREQLSHEESY
ncbi:cytochrome d ubiquinol oxidase subunit II [bacterium]|nr:cytochrome d ubiquinol oxidase subunit II [bacterium]